MPTRRTLGLEVAVLAVAMLVMTEGWLLTEARAQVRIGPFLSHFKCYEITPGTALNEPVRLFDQFHGITGPSPGPGQPPQGGEALVVRSPQLLCTPVLVKCRASGVCESFEPDGDTLIDGPISFADHLKCYKVTPSGPPVNERVTLFDQFHPQTVDNGGGGENVTVRTPQLLCAPAQKCRSGEICNPTAVWRHQA